MVKCTYCQNEMQSGYIPNWSQPVQWLPDGKRPTIFSFSAAKDGVPLINEFRPLKAMGYRAEACYCPKCKIVIAPVKTQP